MQKLIDVQIPIVEFFQKFSSGNLYILWNILSILIATSAFVFFINYYWNIDKDKGYTFGQSLLFSFLINNVLKTILCIERPYSVSSKIERREIGPFGSGKSFPSSHVALTSACFTSSIISFPTSIKYFYYFVLILILMISRITLGMHYPLDVITGLTIGIIFPLFFYKFNYLLKSISSKIKHFSLYYSIILLLGSLTLTLITIFMNLDIELYSDVASSLSLISSIHFSKYFEKINVKFITRARRAKKFLRTILGIIPLICIVYFLSLTNIIISKTIMPFLAMFWIIYLYPYIGIKTNLFNVI